MSGELPIAIVGGGIAGLALALNLHARGIECRVFEAAPEIRELGVGITLLPHAVRELSALGLLDAVRAFGIENGASAFFNRFGQLIYSEARGVAAGYPFPEFGIHRGRLHTLLHDAVIERLGPDAVLTDRRCVGVEQDEAGVTLRFGGDRADERARAVVACDGVNSAVRRTFYPDETVSYTGINTWRGVTRRAPILDGRTYMRVGSLRTGKMVIYPIRDLEGGEQLINWVAELELADAIPNDWNRTAGPDRLLPIFGGWTFDWLDVEDLIRRADTIFEYPMVDKDPIERWTFGRITLAGDAAHPMYPRGSNGSAQALIDVRTLADLLVAENDVAAAFRRYEDARRDVTANVVRTNRASPPDLINIKVEELTGDRPFERLEDFISQDELRAISDRYKAVAGFGVADVARS